MSIRSQKDLEFPSYDYCESCIERRFSLGSQLDNQEADIKMAAFCVGVSVL